MTTTLERAEKLTQYLRLDHRETDPVLDNVLDKLLARERQSLLKQRDELRLELEQFERHYGLLSAEFYAKFQRGEMGDTVDFVDWSGAWRVYQAIGDGLAVLQTDQVRRKRDKFLRFVDSLTFTLPQNYTLQKCCRDCRGCSRCRSW